MAVTIGNLHFKTQVALHTHLNDIRTLPDAEFASTANAPQNAAVLEAIMRGRPRKRQELGEPHIMSWTRKKSGPHYCFYAVLDDGSELDMGVSKADISEFVKNYAVT